MTIPGFHLGLDLAPEVTSSKNHEPGAEEMAQPVRALDVLSGDPGSVPSTHRTTHNSLQLQFQGIRYPHIHNAHKIKNR